MLLVAEGAVGGLVGLADQMPLEMLAPVAHMVVELAGMASTKTLATLVLVRLVASAPCASFGVVAVATRQTRPTFN